MSTPVRRLAFLIAAVGMLTGCGHRFNRHYFAPSPSLQSVAVVAVLPLENLTDYPNAGEIVADLVATELFALGRYKIIDGHTALKLYTDVGGTVPPTFDITFARELGEKIRADAVVYGSVQEFAYRLDKSRQGAREPAVAYSIRMMEVSSGTVLWAASESRSSDAVLSEERDPINRVAQAIARDFREELGGYLAQAGR